MASGSFEQQGIPPERVILFEPEGREFTVPPNLMDFIAETCAELDADLVDVQLPVSLPPPVDCKTVYTMHGLGQPQPEQPFDGVLSVEAPPEGMSLAQYAGQPFAAIHNWVDLQRFPFIEKLGEGACFIGRNFKTVNVLKVAQFWSGTIDCYGIVEQSMEDYPANVKWCGYCDPAEVLPRHRVAFATGQVALEALAMGRLVIAGQHYVAPPGGDLVTHRNIDALAINQFCCMNKSGGGVEPSPEEVYAEFERAMQNDFDRDRRKMRQYVEANHSMEKQVRKVRDFYADVLGNA